MNIKPVILLPVLAILSLLTACTPAPESSETDQLRILTTFLSVYAHAASVAGDRAEVDILVGDDIGVHDFSPRPADMARIADADILVFNGAGIEPWLDGLVRGAGNPDLVLVDLADDMELIPSPPRFGVETGESDEPNPHTWLDPVLAMRQVGTLRDALIAADPEGTDIYRANAERYLERLRKLDADFQRVLGPLPSKKLVTFHDAFPYFARRYGFESLGYISEFPERDPSPVELAALINRIRAGGVKVLFAETGYEPALLQRVAAETGARVSILNTLEIGPSGPDAYLDGMRVNLEALRAAFAE